MRYIIYFLVFLIAIATASGDLVAHYTFDDADDLGANSGSASIGWTSFSNVSQSTGLFGSGAGSFTAGSSSAWTSGFGTAGANLNNFSLSMHIKTLNAGDWKDYISIGTGNEVVFVLENTANGLAIYNIGDVGGDSGGQVLMYNQVDDGEWHHLGMVVTGGETRLYVDGTSYGPSAYLGSGTISALQLASRFGAATRAITTEIDDVGIWNEALSSDDMAYYASNAIPEPITSGLLAIFGAAVFFVRRRIMC